LPELYEAAAADGVEERMGSGRQLAMLWRSGSSERRDEEMDKPITMHPIGIAHSPYVRQFDGRPDAISGWIERHFEDGKMPEQKTAK
jgi:hypothetical protein